MHDHCTQTGCHDTNLQAHYYVRALVNASMGNSVDESVRKSFAKQAMSPTRRTAPPTANQYIAAAYHHADCLEQKLHAAALLTCHENHFDSSSKVQELRQPNKQERAIESEDTSDDEIWDAMLQETITTLLKEKDEDNPCDFGYCLHKAMPAQGKRSTSKFVASIGLRCFMTVFQKRFTKKRVSQKNV